MLNISPNSISGKIDKDKYSSLSGVERKKSNHVFRRILYGFLLLLIFILILPWTQNIRSYGSVTTIRPEHRPQGIHTVIGGQIQRWYVKDGDFVEKGDTLLKITEVKDDYFDSSLIQRTKNQVDLKKESADFYEEKIKTQESQLALLQQQRDLKLSQNKIKLQQAALKVQIDSIAHAAAQVNYSTAKYQYQRMDSLHKKGLKSLTDLEMRNLKVQETKAYEMETKNKWLNSKNELMNLKIEGSNILMDFQSDYNKVLSDKYATTSTKLETETEVNKLENTHSNYKFRNNLYYITAPQSGYVTRTISTGIGETIKEGQQVLTLMPKDFYIAVESYIEPIDVPLLNKGQKVRLQFDGWPAIVFSGWPNVSHGTYGGVVYSIDQFISPNGKYRVLIKPDPEDYAWPKALRFGSGTSTMILLKDVPIWYELWRKINGFPPDYYKIETSDTKSQNYEK